MDATDEATQDRVGRAPGVPDATGVGGREANLRRYVGVASRCASELRLLTDLTTKVFAVPTAYLALADGGALYHVATTGFSPAPVALRDGLTKEVLDEPGVVSVPDAGADPRFSDSPLVDGRQDRVRFYASAPLTIDSGVTIGRLAVFDNEPRHTSENEELMLMLLARQAVDVLESARRAEDLAHDNALLVADRHELERSNQQLSEFAGQVSHDLRAPLSAIMATTEMLLDEPAVTAEPDVSHLVASTMRAVHRMTGLLNDSLAYAVLGARLVRQRVDLNPVVEGVIADLQPLIHNSRATVEMESLPLVEADPEQLYAVFLNLVTNAIKYARPDVPAQVVVDARRRDGYWQLRVSDNGIGVPPERREQIFGLYERLDSGPAGFGIGLATVKRVVRAHGGRVGVTDNEGGGSVIWFELPVDA